MNYFLRGVDVRMGVPLIKFLRVGSLLIFTFYLFLGYFCYIIYLEMSRKMNT